VIAWLALVVAVAAAGFSGWQAWTANRNRRTANERALVEWAHGKWVEPEVIEVRSNGPDEAREVWARMTVAYRDIEVTAARVRRGDVLRFKLPEGSKVREMWDQLEARKPLDDGHDWSVVEVFSYGLRLTWHSPLGTPSSANMTGQITRRVANERPDYLSGSWAPTNPEPDDSTPPKK